MIVITINAEDVPPIPQPDWDGCGLCVPVRGIAGCVFLIPARPKEVCTLPIPAPVRPEDGGGPPVSRDGAGRPASLPGAGAEGGSGERAWYSQFLSFAGWRSFK